MIKQRLSIFSKSNCQIQINVMGRQEFSDSTLSLPQFRGNKIDQTAEQGHEDRTFTLCIEIKYLLKATHSSVLAWRIPGTGEPGGLLSLGSHRVGHD